MRTGSRLSWVPRVSRPRAGAGLCAAVLAVLWTCLGAASASATEQTTVYTLKVIEGETTLPENPIAQTIGSVEHATKAHQTVAVSISRGGTVIAKTNANEGGSSISQVPQVGDVLTFESPAGTVVGSVVYDGLPSMDPTVCAGSASFSGQNSPGETVRGSYITVRLEKYGNEERVKPGRAQVTSLSGTTFGGSFLAPLELGETVTASESLETPLENNQVFKYISENSRPVGACPPVVVPTPPPPAPCAGGLAVQIREHHHPQVPEVGLARPRHHQPPRHGHPGCLPHERRPAGGRLEHPPPQTASGAAARARCRHSQRPRHRHGADEAHRQGPRQAEVLA